MVNIFISMDKQFSLIYGKENIFYKILQINAQIKIKRRLLELGFTNNEKVLILKKSRLKGVFLLQIKEYVLALKKKEVANIIVEV